MNFDGIISDARLEEIRLMLKEKGNNISFKDFAVYEIEIIIEQTPMSNENKEFAKAKYIKRLTHDELLDHMGWGSPNTVTKRTKKISNALKSTCRKIFN